MKYINQFLNLKCSGDILNVVAPIPSKEITESMGIIRLIKGLTIKEPMKWAAVDFWRRVPTIFVSVHSCGKSAEKVINIYNNYEGNKALAIMPCCNGSLVKA